MLTSFIAGIVQFSMRHAYPVIIAALLAAAGAAAYVATHFAISTDVSKLIDQQGVWAQRSRAIDEAFPQRAGLTLAVIEAPAAEFADQAAAELAVRLAQQPERFGTVSRPGAGAFFAHNGLLFVDAADLQRLATQLGSAAPLLSRLAADPSLRGLASLLSLTLGTPLLSGQLQLADLASLLERSAGTIDAVLAGQPAALSWRALVAADTQPRSFVAVHPVPDYGALEAGAAAASEIRRLAVELQLAERYGARVQLTGPRPLADDEFASVRQGAAPNAVATLLAVLLILWLAVRSGKLILAVFVTLIVGLIVTAALGLLMVGALNMISVAFAVLFVGIGVDFGIQFAVRYREERHRADGVEAALAAAARGIALPLSLAAAATAASFFSFLPTAYRGISELGLIAGVGILLVAFPSALTLLPALITVLRPKGEPAAPGFRWLAPVDRYTDRHRWPLLAGTLLLVLAGLPLLAHLRFDFDPLHLKDPHSESMATLLRLADRPEAGINDAQLLSASLADADAAAQRLRRLPEVGRALTLSSFVPADQPAKRAQIEALAVTLRPALEQMPASAGVDAARVLALNRAAGMLDNAVADHPDDGTALLPAQHLAATLRRLAAADAATRDRAEQAICAPLKLALDALRALLAPQPLRLDTLPAEIRAEWMTADGRALVNISPRFAPAASSAADDAQLRRFSAALLRAEPEAIGGPISILHSADTIVRAFVEAGVWALLSITVLLWLALRRLGDVLRTLVPLLVSAVATLELSVLLGWPLNFANIIALPLLLGIGVAFKIYYVMAWRSGKTDLLQSSLTQAVILSAATTATAFGSLWLSHHPGTASMGRLLALSLLCTLFGAVFFQPMLMGRPRARQR